MAGRIAIVGLGLIGGSLALALRRALPGTFLLGVDSDGPTREQAVRGGAVDAAHDFADAPLDSCEVVVLAVPAQALVGLLPAAAARMRRGALLTDVCGAKERVCEAAALQDRVVFVGAHPMAGTEQRGFAAARAELFAGCTVALTPAVGARDDGAASRQARALWQAAGAGRLLEVSPAAHDRAVTFASHLPYLAAALVAESLLAHAGAEAELARELAAGGFRDTTRLAGDGTVSGAAALNRFVAAEARDLADRLRALAAQLETDPAAALARLTRLADERRAMPLPPPAGAPPARKL